MDRSNRRRFFLVILLTLLSVLHLSPTAMAYDLPAVNLGFTTFLDGGPPAGPGLYFTQYFQYYHAGKFKDAKGNDLPLPRPDLNAYISLSQVIYQSNQTVPLTFGAKWGVDVIIPVVGVDVTYNSIGPLPDSNGAGIGDVLVGPFLQWDPIMGKDGPILMNRVEFQATFPTGRYDRNKEINPGSNCFTFNPYWSATLFLTPKWTVSTRFHYLWSSENDDPNRGFAPARTMQAGQAIHLNYATEYEVIPKMLRLGINGYYLKQIADTQADGRDIPDRREQVFAIGPGVLFSFSQNDHLFFNAFFEMEAENRTQGDRFNLRWVHHF
ncbi:MAG TPA: transporter [Geobacteraceae bacterium]|nr:transporter [Geobacteraceae bacterium]